MDHYLDYPETEEDYVEPVIRHVEPTLPSLPFPEKDYSWREFAACKGAPFGLFFATTMAAVAEQKRFCAACPSVQQCLDFAVMNGEKHGTWGGKTAQERLELARG
jgi:WhiB family redox-sensing transcriptional regulator